MSPRFKITAHDNLSAIEVELALTSEQLHGLFMLQIALEEADVEDSLRIKIERLDVPDHKELIDQLTNERNRVNPKTPTNPAYHAYSRAISALKELDALR